VSDRLAAAMEEGEGGEKGGREKKGRKEGGREGWNGRAP
jgi:hypothetical protein